MGQEVPHEVDPAPLPLEAQAVQEDDLDLR